MTATRAVTINTQQVTLFLASGGGDATLSAGVMLGGYCFTIVGAERGQAVNPTNDQLLEQVMLSVRNP